MGNSALFHDRDQPQPFRSMEPKWDSQQVEVFQNVANSRKDAYLMTRNNMEYGNIEERRLVDKQENRGRKNSLRHVKNSTEVLRQQSTKRAAKESVVDANTAAREGRQFTVASVGNNGKIYLRPTARPSHQRPQSPPFGIPSASSPNIDKPRLNGKQTSYDQLRDGDWSDTQKSRTPTHVRRAQSTERGTQLSKSSSQRSVKRSRTHSLSTADDQINNQKPRAGEFKIVIDHPNPVSRHLDKVQLPTIEVPIPHYRLGTPRFSARGTAFLHSSVYTRNSTNEDIRSSAFSRPEHEKLFPGIDSRSVISRRHSHASPQPYSVRIAPINEHNTNVAVTSSPAFHRSKAPIVSAIFDAMAANPDDPAIVRYYPNTREITAASPARIIAQITSKNFLDYELLSDFFLTVRAYLPIHDLLAYLLARFEWAINRFDDDGRVIRVRAFAALRHWILNYFPYDFVIDRDLRVEFCERLNALSRTVCENSLHGPSDSKLIHDLKKCWNGRCALYWDNQSFENDGRHDVDINPGGIAGSRDSQLTHPSQLWTRAADPVPLQIQSTVDPKESATALNNWFDAVIEAEDMRTKRHERQGSIITSRSLPTSPISEQSIPVLSCTLPGMGFKKLIGEVDRKGGPHPVPVTTPRRPCPAAPSASANDRPSHPNHAHKRSGSFSDAFRDKRASLPSMGVPPTEEPVMMAFPYSGSLIRGSVLPPGSPYLDGFISAASMSDLRSMSSHSDESDGPESSKYSSPLSPGVKNLFGTIRRALSSKQASTHQSSANAGNAAAPSFKGSSNVSQQLDAQAERRNIDTLPKHSRIDLLCADVAEVYHRVIAQVSEEEFRPMSRAGLALKSEQPQWTEKLYHEEMPSSNVRTPPVRNNSELTYGSRSIVVFDDTANYPPVPTIPPRSDILAAEERLRGHKDVPLVLATQAPPPKKPETEPSPVEPHEARPQTVPRSRESTTPKPTTNEKQRNPSGREDFNPAVGNSRVVSSHRPEPSPLSRGRSYKSTHSGSRSLRKYASYQSGMVRSGPEHAIGTSVISDSFPGSSMENSYKPPGRMLRRRPGGDLRANQNVHDLEQLPRSRSVGSITTYTDSMRGSESYMNRPLKSFQSRRSSQPPLVSPLDSLVSTSEKPLSLVRTHSSQPALRPSFEAAVAQFARIPDDEGGDIEATLLKLEGKYRRTPPIETSTVETNNGAVAENPSITHQPNNEEPKIIAEQTSGLERIERDHNLVPVIDVPSSPGLSKEGSTPAGEHGKGHRYNMASSLYAESEESYNSTPLLERDHSNESRTRDKSASNSSKVSIPRPLFSRNQSEVGIEPNLLSPLAEPGVDTDSQRRIRYRSSIPTTTDSFLLDEDEYLSDLSSELSIEMVNHDEMEDNVFGSSAQLLQNGITPSNSGNVAGSSMHPPTPPMTKETAMAIKSQANRMQDQRKPPTPDPSPVHRHVEPAASNINEVPKIVTPQPLITPSNKFSTHRHLPFVLLYDSAVVAEQLTIIEKDALNEINWQDLINMRWHHKAPSTLNWVDYLRTQEPTGIELVTARFNIVVKWVLSEIVLTQNVEERALCIIKYIHIAKHCRKTSNYATLLQLTIALTSIDCSRLTKTWDLVPFGEKKSLIELEDLVTPIKNFNNLRQEMETANTDDGCIPVIALYIHDLTYNSQKPSQIAGTRDGEPLINFERYRTTATIVKSLLRLIDASAKYAFQPVEGIIERCLWMASLTDDMIRFKSKELE